MEKRLRFPIVKGPASHHLYFRASVDGIKAMTPSVMASLSFTITCTNCGKQYPNFRINPSDALYEEDNNEEEDKKRKFMQTCSECNKLLTLEVVDDRHENTFPDYSKWCQFMSVDLQGCRIDVIGCDSWKIISNSDTEYEWDSQSNFSHYDEKLDLPIGISDLDFVVRSAKQI